MSLRYDYIMNQIEKATRLIAALISSKKIELEQEADINQTLAELTGFDLDTFAGENNAASLLALLSMLDDDNKKAVAAMLLQIKSEELYSATCLSLLEQVDRNKLRPNVKKLLARSME